MFFCNIVLELKSGAAQILDVCIVIVKLTVQGDRGPWPFLACTILFGCFVCHFDLYIVTGSFGGFALPLTCANARTLTVVCCLNHCCACLVR